VLIFLPLGTFNRGMKKVLVTGGAGYIGSHTAVELTAAGYIPVIADNFSNSDRQAIEGIAAITQTTPKWIEIDFCDTMAVDRMFEEQGPFVGVIHFAAFKAVGESVRNPLKYYTNNLQSTANVLAAMKKFGIKNLVFSSSCTVYGQPEELPVTESTCFMPANSPYGYTKQIGERMICDFICAEGAPYSAMLLRYFNPIGAHPSGLIGELPIGAPENLIPYITQTAAGWRKGLTIFGNDYNTPDGTCIRDYIHVCDLAEAHVAALDWLAANPGECTAVNLGTGKGNSVKEVIDTFIQATGVQLEYHIGNRRPGDVEKIYALAEKAQSLLGWTTKRTLHDAIVDAWNWQRKLDEKKVHLSAHK
jgi:UDP-glucose 4-epimerase